MQHNYKLTIAYDGTNYHGWQIQPNGISIQQVIQEQIAIILRQEVTLIGSGRTDSGVHALEQVAHFHFPEEIDLKKFHQSINGLLPHDIRVLEVLKAPLTFHAQHAAKGKIYHYNIQLGRIHNPFYRLYRTHFSQEIDRNKLKEAAKYFIGTHDFTSFTNQPHKGSCAIDPVRTIKRLDVIEEDFGIRLEFEGNGFLYKMVRNITGTLLAVATGKIEPSQVPNILLAKDRKKAFQAAPAQGLFLVKVIY